MGTRLPRCRMPAVGVLVGLALAGCQGMSANDSGMFETSSLKWWDRREDEDADQSPSAMQRMLDARRADALDRRIAPSPEALADYEAAERLFKAGEYKAAEKAFDAIVDKYDGKGINWRFWETPDDQVPDYMTPDQLEQSKGLFSWGGNRKPGVADPVVEDAMFMRAEAQFEQKRYAAAQDSYTLLMKDYPSTRHMDTSTQRLFRVAQIWLDFPEIVTAGDVQQVNMEEPKRTPPPTDDRPTSYDPTRAVPILPNLHDRTRPVFDTDGRALEALKSIWLNDPTGALADDALMMTASHQLREGDFLGADETYAQLREMYPKSPHLPNAFLLGSHTQLVSYQGPGYDGTTLEGSRKLAESLLRLYPNHPERERLLDQIRRIDEAAAEREWETVLFWRKKGRPVSEAACCREVIRLYPNSPYAGQARSRLAELEGQRSTSPLRGILPPRLLPALGSEPEPTPEGGDGGAGQ